MDDDFVKILIDEIFKVLEDAVKDRPLLLTAVKLVHRLALSMLGRLTMQISQMPGPLVATEAPKRKR